MSAEDRKGLAKYLSALLAIPAVFGVAVPYVDVYVPEGQTWLFVLPIAGVTAAGIRGVHALVYPGIRAAHPFSIWLGVLVASMLVLASPEAIRLAIVNYPLKPLWIWSSVGGLLLAAVYIAFVFRSRKTQGQPPNTSLERTRGR
jgi:hypothetical protein